MFITSPNTDTYTGACPGIIKKFLLLLIVLCAGWLQKAVAQAYLFDLALSAEKIILGTITKVEDHHFYLAYAERGKVRKLRIVKQKYPAAAPRFAPYTAGQKLLAFVSYYNGDYRLLGNGAELPLIKDSVVIPMSYFTTKTQRSLVPGGSITEAYKAQQTFTVAGRKVFGLKFPVLYLYRSMFAFRDCYQIILKKDPFMAGDNCFNFFDRITRDRLNVAKRSSKLLRLLYNDMEEAQKINCP